MRIANETDPSHKEDKETHSSSEDETKDESASEGLHTDDVEESADFVEYLVNNSHSRLRFSRTSPS